MKPRYFRSQDEFRDWLKKNHRSEDELLVGFHKVKTGRPSMTWSESVDQALCYGWIDGIRRSVDDERYCIRFTPRRAGSNWSAINIRKVETLTKKRLMRAAGLAAWQRRQDHKSDVYGYEKPATQLDKDYEKTFRANRKAWAFFSSQAPSYQRQIYYWVMSARREQTRARRLNKLIECSKAGKRVY